ncbi:LuxR C-terminal-related transcriptional regulator [Streptomyces sp. NPDC006173]|uniref:helix-turn-helix transcriptional regulator n=1 Tax=Streptomyces sp. NPDC006173 TaxID=3155349 RepID=UPI0033D9A15F
MEPPTLPGAMAPGAAATTPEPPRRVDDDGTGPHDGTGPLARRPETPESRVRPDGAERRVPPLDPRAVTAVYDPAPQDTPRSRARPGAGGGPGRAPTAAELPFPAPQSAAGPTRPGEPSNVLPADDRRTDIAEPARPAGRVETGPADSGGFAGADAAGTADRTDESGCALGLIDAAEQARLAGLPGRARELLARAGCEGAPDAVRGAAQLVHGQLGLQDGPVADAREVLLLAAELLAADPARALAARLAAMEAAWAMGDAAACLEALDRGPGQRGSDAVNPVPGAADPEEPDRAPGQPETDGRVAAYRAGMSAVMHGRLDTGRRRLREVVAATGAAGIVDGPESLLLAGGAALVAGDLSAACRANSRALAVARARGPYILVAQALERLAYGELRAGRHARARAHAEDGLRTALAAGQSNLAAHHHAILALVASVEGSQEAVAEHASAAERMAAPHGLAQAATLSQWARARADLARGRLPEAAARLGPLVGAGPRHGHFAIRMLAVPCFVEAAARTGQEEAARSAVAEFTHWTAQGADPQAPAQLARCRALLSDDDGCEPLFTAALAHHEEVVGDFERGRTQLLYGAWLRRRRRPGEARGRLRDALVSFERGGALGWAAQTRAELRATGDASPAEPAGPLALLTPQQLRIARCVAEGATNREVALRLSVSPRTVDHHLRNVFAALGVRSRVELSRWVDRAEKTTAHP